jgi:hypothetical protein
VSQRIKGRGLIDYFEAKESRLSAKTSHFGVAFARAVGMSHVVDEQLFEDDLNAWQQFGPGAGRHGAAVHEFAKPGERTKFCRQSESFHDRSPGQRTL